MAASGVDSRAPLLEIRGLRVHLASGPGRVPAVDGVDLDLVAGQVLALVGGPGSGRTSLLRAITRLVEPAGGTVRVEGGLVGELDRAGLRALRGRVGLMFSDPGDALSPRRTAAEAVLEPLDAQERGTPGQRRRRVVELLAEVGLPTPAWRLVPQDLDPGRRTRVGLARALACDPVLLLCDEPL